MNKLPRQDETFGTLIWDDTLDYWTGLVALPSVGPVRISVDAEDDEEITPEEAFHNAHRAYLALREKEPDARAFAAEALLDVYNREWNVNTPLEEDAFVEQLTLEDITFSPDGSLELFYNAADLFRGHTVIVTLDEDSAFDDVEIAG